MEKALPQQRSRPWRRILIWSAVVLVVALLAGVLPGWLWLRGYQPLHQGSGYGANPADGMMVSSPSGSGGSDVFFPRYRPHGTVRVLAWVANGGRFTVTI